MTPLDKMKDRLEGWKKAEEMATLCCHRFLIRPLALMLAHCFRDLNVNRKGAEFVDVRTIRGDRVEAYRGMERGDWASPGVGEES